MSTMKKFFKIAVSVIVILAVVVAGGIFYITRGLDEGSRQVINTIDLSSVGDGVYHGKYVSGRWTNELDVTVKDHKITSIKVVRDVTFPKPEWAQQLFNRVIEKQNTDVEVVSGATVTSKAYLKAIENALKK